MRARHTSGSSTPAYWRPRTFPRCSTPRPRDTRSCSTGIRASSRGCARSTRGTKRAPTTRSIARSSSSISTALARTARTSSRRTIMNTIIRNLAVLACLACAMPANAALKILATTADWGALATELGGDRVSVYTATSAFQDVHRVDAKPSLIARTRTADLVVATGAQLEIGWFPVLLQELGNSRIQPGSSGYFEAAVQVQLLDVPSAVDRT